jgi:hypothetical protein
MIAMLAVLGMLISRAADPRTWKWLATESRPEPHTQEAAKLEPETVSPGPTDLDPDERAAAAEQFQAISDRTIELSREEMPAYWRLFSWIIHQSLDDLKRRANPAPVLNQFIQTPDEQRGKLFQLDLNVRRVLSFDAPPNSAGIEKVYEVWGWTSESKAWLYVVLTAQLPHGMPVGPDVNERATFAGYFFKLQGYHAAGAGPHDKPLVAPLLIGRLDWKPAVPVSLSHDDFWWLLVLAGIAALYGVTRLTIWLFSGNRRSVSATSAQADQQPKDHSLRDWLAKAEQSPAAEGERHTPPFLEN